MMINDVTLDKSTSKMTIKGLWELIDKDYPHVMSLMSKEALRGYRVTIDAHNLMYICRALVRNRFIYSRDIIREPLREDEMDIAWISMLTDRVLEWVNRGITPVLVFDGPPPIQKIKVRSKRDTDKDNVRAKIAELIGDPTSRHNAAILEKVRSLSKQLNTVPMASVELAKCFFMGLGLPVITSTTDGERLCAALCREGYAAAVYSSDSDTPGHLAPVVLKSSGPMILVGTVGGSVAQSTYITVTRDSLLQALGLSETSFRDFCIMCGTDYNENIKGIGTKRSLDYIRKYGNIETVLQHLKPNTETERLDYERCRELYALVPSKDIMGEGTLDLTSWHDDMQDHINTYGLMHKSSDIERSLKDLKKPNDFKHRPIPRVVYGSQVSLLLIDSSDQYDILPIMTTWKCSRCENQGIYSKCQRCQSGMRPDTTQYE